MLNEVTLNKNAIIFWADSYQMGLTYHFSRLIPYLRVACSGSADFFVISHKSEQNPGLWDYVLEKTPASSCYKYSNWDTPECLKDIENDIVSSHEKVLFHVQGPKQVRKLIPLKKKFGSRIKIVVWVHSFRNGNGNLQRIITSAIVGRLYRKWVDKVIFLSPFAWKNFIGGSRMIREGKAHFLPLSVESFSDFSCPTADNLPLSFLNTLESTDVFKIIYLANFLPNKGHGWLLEGCIPVLRQHPNMRVFFLGDGPFRVTIEKQAAEAGIKDQVLTPGRISRTFIPWILQHCHVAITGTGSENAGHNAIEPYLAGIPVIGTRVGSAEYLLQDFNIGIGVGHHNSLQLSQMLEMAFHDPQMCYEMGKKGKLICETLFTHEAVCGSLAKMYSVLLSYE